MTENHRIVHITTVHKAVDQRILHRECVSLAKCGYEVSLLARCDSDCAFEGVKLISLGQQPKRNPGLYFFERLSRIRKAFEKAIGLKADVYHFHDPELIGAGLSLKKRTGARIIYDCHEDNVAYMLQKKYIPAPVRQVMAAIIKFHELKAVKTLDAIVTADEGMRSYFAHKGARRAVTVDNFPRLDLFLEKADDIIPRYDLVYHGTIPRYHLETCFAVDAELVSRNIAARWLFIGKYSDLDWAKEEVRKKKAENRFTFHGVVPHHDIAKWVRLGRIGIIPLPNYPKFQRNIPTKLFEFMALRMPVVLSDLPPSRPFVGDGKCAFMVNPDSPSEYADAVAYLLNHPQHCSAMGEEGYRRVASNYNWDASFKELRRLYEELLYAPNHNLC